MGLNIGTTHQRCCNFTAKVGFYGLGRIKVKVRFRYRYMRMGPNIGMPKRVGHVVPGVVVYLSMYGSGEMKMMTVLCRLIADIFLP